MTPLLWHYRKHTITVCYLFWVKLYCAYDLCVWCICTPVMSREGAWVGVWEGVGWWEFALWFSNEYLYCTILHLCFKKWIKKTLTTKNEPKRTRSTLVSIICCYNDKKNERNRLESNSQNKKPHRNTETPSKTSLRIYNSAPDDRVRGREMNRATIPQTHLVSLSPRQISDCTV